MAALDARLPDRTNPLPLWAQILDDLRRRLDAGEFDESFPPEVELRLGPRLGESSSKAVLEPIEEIRRE